MEKNNKSGLEQRVIEELKTIKNDICDLNDEVNANLKRSLIDKLKRLLDYIYEIREFYDDKTSANFISLINEYYDLILRDNYNYLNNEKLKDQLMYLNDYLDNLFNESERIKLMNQVSNVHKNVVIVGPNGSGKSSLVNNLATSSLNNITALPAQKLLFFNEKDNDRDKINIKLYRKYTDSDVFNLFKDESEQWGNVMTGLRDTPLRTFTLLISLLYKEHDKAAIKCFENKSKDENSKLKRLRQIWSKVLPDIELITDTDNRSIKAHKNNEDYSINQLSDGEKSIIFYIGNVLFATKHGYIIIDEPETFLNPSIYNKLWDILMEERNDCQFIFTSHNTEFINSRSQSQLVICNGFTPPNNFDLQVIDGDKNLPREIISELLGSKKTIMLCEGNYHSDDYLVYSRLFNNYTVIPVKGHEQVIKYTEALNGFHKTNQNIVNVNVYGIIDGDYWNEHDKKKYNDKNVFVLPYNEIEMLLLDKRLLEETVKYDNRGEESKVNEMLVNFYNQFFDSFNDKKDSIVLSMIKFELDHMLRNNAIDKKIKNKNDINDGLNNIDNIINTYKNNIDDKYNEYIDSIEGIIKTHQYKKLLSYCSLKGQVTKSLARKCFDMDYVQKALLTINHDKDVRASIVQNIKDNNMII